jgi:twinkle protein
MIASETIEQAKSAANIVDVIGGFVKLKKRGSDYEGLCPFHSEKTPSFKVHQGKGIYKCFGCGKSGDVISFLIRHENLDYVGAIKWLCKKYNIQIEENTKEYAKPAPRLEKLSNEVISYFEEKRGISNNTLLRHKVTETKEWMPGAAKEIPVICFNYFRNDELVNIKFRGKNKDFKSEKNSELIFYNLDSIKDENEVVIVEGEIDCLTMYECGIYNSVSVPNGASKGKQNLQYLDNCWQYFEGKEKIIIAVDKDEPGELLKEELGRRLGKERCFLVEYPEGCKDSNEVLVKFGCNAIKELVSNAKQWPIEGIILVEDLYEEVVDFYVDGYPEGAKAHIAGFDELLSFVPGQMTAVTGIPGSGKDEFINDISVGLSRYEDWKFGICGFEEPASITVTKLQEKFVKKAFGFRKNNYQRIDETEFKWSLNIIKDHYYFINIEQVGARLENVLNKAADLVKRYGINGLILNPWNCFEHNKKNGQSETEYVSECLTMINNFDIKYGVHTFLIAHPTKIQKRKDTGKYEVPTLYSISGSAHFFNKTFNGISIYRDFATNVVDVYVQKVKWYWLGKLGFCSFDFNVDTRQYVPIHVPENKPFSQNGHTSSWVPVNSVLPKEKDDEFDNGFDSEKGY